MPKPLSDGQWACEAQGCSYKNTKEGYVRNHEKLKHGGTSVNTEGQETSKKIKKTGVCGCPSCKGNDVRLLNLNNPGEGRAKQADYRYICGGCGEVFK